MVIINTIISLLAFPVLLLNILGGLVGGVWLAFLGEWKMIGLGLAMNFLGSWILSGPILLGGLIAWPATQAAKRGRRKLMLTLTAAGILYTVALMVTWAGSSMVFFIEASKEKPIWPFLLFSYGAATSPWIYMAKKEQEGSGYNPSMNMAGFLSMSYVMALMAVAFGFPAAVAIAVLAVCTMCGGLINYLAALEIEKAARLF